MSKAFVVSACGTVDEHMIEVLRAPPEAEKFLRDPDCCGGSVIVAPNSRIIAGPMGAEEGILYADCDLELGVMTKLRHDFSGHYNRPDIFQLHVNRSAPHLYTVHGGTEELPPPQPASAELSSAPDRLLTSPRPSADRDEISPNRRGRDEP